KMIAEQLMKIAAQRELRSLPPIEQPAGLYEEFCARFPYPETEDQERAISQVIDDLSSGRPMDRLVCGDVGFGKTEVALRAAFLVALSGQQVALIVPTTLLARQHYATFKERFAGMPVRIGMLSRLVGAKDSKLVKEELSKGTLDIVIGTHTLLGEGVKTKRLGMVIVDEEQHFGVKQKEKLKQLRADVHVLTLSATPIPRTLQMAMSGLREMSLIATPPVDRLAVRTFVLPYDPIVVREAILRELHRGGQSFYVCPRLEDLPLLEQRLKDLVPEVKVGIAHGRLTPNELEEVMTGFYERRFDVLLSTNIVESGLDIPTANTLIIHRADMFGLSQLYQLRGRIGRGKIRGYAYLTLPPGRLLSSTAQRRLHVMQTLDHLGAGFTLASHDLDIRGAGNLLGEEQSGHIREVGVELYQQMLEEAVATAKGEAETSELPDAWSPQLNLGTSVLIPEAYVADLDVRLGLYRRLSQLEDRQEIEAFAAELIDRFGPLPEEVENLLDVMTIKQLCRRACVEKVDSGPKGLVIAFHNDSFPNPGALVSLIQQQVGKVQLRPDHRLVYRRSWTSSRDRLKGVRLLLNDLAEMAQAA
ncbi:MAG: helicase-related protein, partial [Limibacillus sp.]